MSIILRRPTPYDTYHHNTIPHQFGSRITTCAAHVTSNFSALLNHSGWRWETASPAEAGVDLLFNNYK